MLYCSTLIAVSAIRQLDERGQCGVSGATDRRRGVPGGQLLEHGLPNVSIGLSWQRPPNGDRGSDCQLKRGYTQLAIMLQTIPVAEFAAFVCLSRTNLVLTQSPRRCLWRESIFHHFCRDHRALYPTCVLSHRVFQVSKHERLQREAGKLPLLSTHAFIEGS